MALFVTVLGASLLGSLHCAGMCGPLVLLYADGKRTTESHLLYHGGRLVTYAALGALAGAFGGWVDLVGTLVGVAQLAALLAALFIASWGALRLAESLGRRLPEGRMGRALKRVSLSVSKTLLGLPQGFRALGLGLASALLPCGWLYAFVAVAAGTGHAALGALAMTGFWLGTVPALLTVGVGARSLLGPLRTKAPLLAAVSLILVGLVTIGVRARNLDAIHAWAGTPAAELPTPAQTNCQ